MFEGVVGKSYQGDIAVDDVQLINSPCPLPGNYNVSMICNLLLTNFLFIMHLMT